MISCELMGRLGNELFQIAAGYCLAKKHNYEFIFPEFTSSKFFNSDFVSKQEFIPQFIHNQKQFHYYKREYQPGTLYKGYYQSSKFFEGFDNEVRELFSLKEEYKVHLSEDERETCSIHVRRGDYLTLEQFHPVQTMRYFDTAIKTIIDKVGKVKFMVFSDDIKWCKENFPYDNMVFNEGSMIEDFSTMISCKHHIISNSSFSWWTSYLSPIGVTIAPKRWFGPALSHETQDIYEKDWIIL